MSLKIALKNNFTKILTVFKVIWWCYIEIKEYFIQSYLANSKTKYIFAVQFIKNRKNEKRNSS
jgi:hypothetical protein